MSLRSAAARMLSASRVFSSACLFALVSIWVLLHRRFARVLKFLVQSGFLRRQLGGTDKIMLEEFLKHVEGPFRLAGFYLDDLARAGALHRMGTEIADVTDRINGIRDVTG